MAAERISVFKAFENKLLQFPGCRVGLAEGFLGRLLLESRPQGPQSGEERVRREGMGRVSWEHFCQPSVWLSFMGSLPIPGSKLGSPLCFWSLSSMML